MVSMALTAEYTGDAPNIAVLDGLHIPVGPPASMPSASFPGVERVMLPATTLGFATPSLVLATRVEAAATPLIAVATLPSHVEAAAAYTSAGSLLDPLFRDWLGKEPDAALLLLDLPLDKASPAQAGDALLLSLDGDAPSQLAGNLSGPLTHAYFHSPRAWLSEGVAGLMSVLWTERTEGHDKALQQLGGSRDALSIAEPATPGVSGGQSLIAAEDAIFYRTKATYVLWMLRGIVGDAVLGSTLRAYDPAKDTTPDYFEKLLEGFAAVANAPIPGTVADRNRGVAGNGTSGAPTPGSLPGSQSGELVDQQSETPASLPDFFKAWVYDDPGLPDLTIANVFSSKTGAGDQWLVAVTIGNSGYAEADVPVIVHSDSSNVTVQVRVPARGTLSRRIPAAG